MVDPNTQALQQLTSRIWTVIGEFLRAHPDMPFGAIRDEIFASLWDEDKSEKQDDEETAEEAEEEASDEEAKVSYSASTRRAAVTLRTKTGIEVYRKAVLAALKNLGGVDIRAVQVQERIGGTEYQLRSMLNRLISDGEVTYTGQRATTRYSLAS